jgi:hypothetical protein
MSIVGGLVDTHRKLELAGADTRMVMDWLVRRAWPIVMVGMVVFWLLVAAALYSAL